MISRGPTAPVLEVDDVVVRYGAVVAVNQAALEVHQGEIVALIGPNGAGKTSLFNAIAGVVPLTSGSVRFHGQSLDRLPPHGRARLGIGRTFQGGRLFGRLTLRENLELAHHHAGRSGLLSAFVSGRAARLDRRREQHVADVALAAMGLEEFADTTCLALPYGVQRRAEVARALCLEPTLLLLDEPSGGLDLSESADLAATIHRLRETLGISVLLIEHDMEFVMNLSDYIYVLDFGNPLAEGRPDEIRSDQTVVAAYLGADVA